MPKIQVKKLSQCQRYIKCFFCCVLFFTSKIIQRLPLVLDLTVLCMPLNAPPDAPERTTASLSATCVWHSMDLQMLLNAPHHHSAQHVYDTQWTSRCSWTHHSITQWDASCFVLQHKRMTQTFFWTFQKKDAGLDRGGSVKVSEHRVEGVSQVVGVPAVVLLGHGQQEGQHHQQEHGELQGQRRPQDAPRERGPTTRRRRVRRGGTGSSGAERPAGEHSVTATNEKPAASWGTSFSELENELGVNKRLIE